MIRPRAVLFSALILASAAALPGAGCGDDAAAPAGLAPVMPLDVGNTWHYALRANEPGALVVDVSRTVTGHREISHDGRTLTVAVEMPSDVPVKFLAWSGRLLRNEADGLYSYGAVDPDGTVHLTDRTLVAPRAGRPGDRFAVGPDRFLVCVAADSLVATGFGEARADVYELLLDEGTIRVPDVCVVPGVGLTRYYHREWTGWLTGYAFD